MVCVERGVLTRPLRYKVPIDAVDTHRPKPKGTGTVDLEVPLSTSARQYLTTDVVEDGTNAVAV